MNESVKELTMPESNNRFAANLVLLRKGRGFSQEQLAERLGVSRQSVSKWESGVCLPELATLDALCTLYGCTLDALLRGSVEEQSLALLEQYDKGWNAFARCCTFGVAVILTGVTASAFCLAAGLSEEWQIVCTFAAVILGVMVLIVGGLQFDAFEKKCPAVDVVYPPERIEAFDQRFAWLIAGPVGLILLGVLIPGLLEAKLGENLSGALFLVCITVAVTVMVWAGMQKGKYETPEDARRKRDDPAYARREGLMSKSMAVLWISVALLYVLWGLTRPGDEGWRNGWPIFVAGGMLSAILVVVLKKEEQ